MEFIARTVTHPNSEISRDDALDSLKNHPEFKKGSVVVGLKQTDGQWVATIHEPKVAAPPFLDDEKPDEAPSDPEKPEDPEEPSDLKEELDDSDDGDKKDDKSEKASIDSIMDVVKQIAQAVGVPPPGGDKGDKGPEPMDDPLPPMGPDAPPKAPPMPPPPHGKGPMGTPLGSPSFASVQQPKMASFDIDEPWDGTIKEAKEGIEAQYGQFGYKVKKIREARATDGVRRILARVSVR